MLLLKSENIFFEKKKKKFWANLKTVECLDVKPRSACPFVALHLKSDKKKFRDEGGLDNGTSAGRRAVIAAERSEHPVKC